MYKYAVTNMSSKYEYIYTKKKISSFIVESYTYNY